METKVETITVEKAKVYLGKNHTNRPIRPTVVRFYSDIIRRGKWKLTHQGIAFDELGNLLDGQHRLQAIVSTGIDVPMSVTRNASAASFDCMDLGLKRSMSDILQVNRKYAEVYTTMARTLVGQGNISVDMVEDVAMCMSPLITELLDYAPTTATYFSSASSRLCAALRMADSKNKPYVKDLYRQLVLAQLEIMPPVGQAITRQLLTGRVRGGFNYDTLARMWQVFDKTKMNTTKIVVGEPAPFIGLIRQFYISRFGRMEWMKF